MSKFFTNKLASNQGIPFQYICRDHTKTGAEAFLRGHNTLVRLSFACDTTLSKDMLDIYVKEKTGWIDEYLHEVLDDTVLVSTKDPLANVIIILEQENMIDVRLMKDVTRHGLQEMFIEDFGPIVTEQTEGKIELAGVDVFEAMAFE